SLFDIGNPTRTDLDALAGRRAGEGRHAQPLLVAAASSFCTNLDASASPSACAHPSHHTSTVLWPSFTLMALPSSGLSQAAQVFVVMVHLVEKPSQGTEQVNHRGARAAVENFSDQRRRRARCRSVGVRP